MTTLLLALQKNYFYQSKTAYVYSEETASTLFFQKRTTYAMFGGILILVTAYIVSLYLIFYWGFTVRTNNEVAQVLEDERLSAEVMVQRKESSLVKDHKIILESMEKISAIRYVRPVSFAVSGVGSHNP